MTNNRLRCLIISISIGLIVLFIVGAIIYLARQSERKTIDYDACPRPKQFATDYDFDYTKKTNEYRNTNSSIDYFRLSLSWSPTFCKTQNGKNLFQCQHSFGFVVHGLWPSTFKKGSSSHSHPRNCRNEKPMPIEIIRKYFCMMPSENLMQGEWEKHGTCYWEKPEEYFEQIKSLYSKINIPNGIHEILNDQRNSKRERIRQSFLNLNPELKSENIDINIGNRGKTLKEIGFCYDRSFNHIACNHNM
ncbi:unnamed protein product [Rotaria magnacalcarata]|uniref:Uncharacterized protein n=2 Tax=Rotaria magnacalcarata TaxID=392030 RepID=A0A816XJY6_9BILA|nr:unnamed protein product [Rotaria magnacalcarata]